MKKILSRLPANYKLLILDCCHAGGAHRGAFKGEQDVQNALNEIFQGTANVILTACARYERTRELDTLDGGAGFLSWALASACTTRFHESSQDGHSLSLANILRWLPLVLEEINGSLNENERIPLPEALIYTRGGDGEIWFTQPGGLFSSKIESNERQERESRLKALLADHTGFMRDRLASFVGRQQELAQIRQRIEEKLQTGGYITITGQAGQGKSSIITKLVEKYGVENVAYHFIPFNPGPDHQVGLLRNLMARLIHKYNLSDLYVATESRAALRDYFSKVLTEIATKGEREVVFVDGLDQLEEDLTGVRDLSFLPTNPPQGIVLVLGTRPNDTLKPLALLKPHCEYKLPNLSRHDFDLILQHRHVDLDKGLADEFYRVMQENALYLDLVARELAEGGVTSPIEMIRRIANNPNSIFSLAMARFKRHHTQWREVIKPILGVLLTAREPLSVRHIRQILDVEDDWLREGIERLGGLIAKDGQQRYSLFHLKLQDYLRQDENNPDKEYIFATDEEEEWHKKLALWGEQGNISAIWQNVKGNPTEQGRREYARRHYVTHLYQAKEWQQLIAVLDAEVYGKEKIRDDPSTRSFAQDLNLGRYAAAREEETMEKAIEMLPRLWRYTLLGCSLTSRADRYPIEAFEAMIWLKRETEAVGLAELLTRLDYKVEVLLRIAKQFGEQNREQEYLQMLLRAYEVACTVKESEAFIRVLSELGMELIRTHLWEQAEELANTIKEREIQTEVLSNLSMELIKAQRWEWADKVSHSIKESGVRTEVLSNLSMELIKARQWDRAQEIIRTIESGELHAKLLSELSMELSVAQQWDQAEKVASTIKDRAVLDRTLWQLAISFGKVQQWDRAEKVASTIKDRAVLDNVKAELGIELVKAHKWERAEEVAGTIKDRAVLDNVKARLSIELAKVQQWDRAEKVASTIKDRAVLDNVKAELGIELAKAHKWKRAEEVACYIETYGERTRALTELSVRLIEAQQWDRAEKMIRAIEESGERIRILCELSITLAEVQNLARAEKFWVKIRKEVRNIEDWKRIGVLSDLIADLGKAQQWERAEQIVRTFEEDEVYADLLYVLVAALAKAQKWERAEEKWDEAENIDLDRDYGIRNKALYELGIALTKAQQWDQAEEIWEEAEQSLLEADYSEVLIEKMCDLVAALAKAGQWWRTERALEKVEKYINTEWSPEDRPWILMELGEALVKVLQLDQTEVETQFIVRLEKHARKVIESNSALVKESLWNQAEKLANAIEDDVERTEVLSELSLELAKAQQWNQAEKLANAIEDDVERTRVLGELSIELAKAQQWESAEEVANTIEESGERARILYVLVASLAKAQEWGQADEVWLEATELRLTDEESVQALSELGTVLAKAQQLEWAKEVWMQAKKEIDNIQGYEESLQALVKLTTMLAKAQQLEWAMEVWMQAKKEIVAIQSDEGGRDEIFVELEEEVAFRKMNNTMCLDQALKELSLVLIHAQQWDLAEEVSHLIREQGTRVEVTGKIHIELDRAKQWSRNEKVWVELTKEALVIEDDWIRIETLRELGIALAQVQQWERAETVARMIEEPSARADVLIQLGVHMAQQGQWEHAKQMWRLTEVEILAIEDSSVRTEILQKLATAMAQMQQWERAETVARMIEEPSARADVLIQLGVHMAQQGQWKRAKQMWSQAERVASKIWEHKARSGVLQKLGTAMAQAQEWGQAEKLWLKAEEDALIIKEIWAKDKAFGEISKSLALVRQWERSEQVAKKIKGNEYRSQLMIELSKQLARAQRWDRAKAALAEGESIAHSIENIETKTMLLKEIAVVLSMLKDHEQLLHLVQRCWLQASTREDAIKMLPLVNELILLKPEIGLAFYEAFKWTDIILKG